MSDNRTTLQQHNIRINENNSDLSSILEEINNLPLVDVPTLQDKNVVPTTETQEIVADDGYTGLSKVTVEKITGDTLEVTPSAENQSFSGVYTDVTVAGDENLVAENIKKDVAIFGVVGSAESGGATPVITDGYYLFAYDRRIDNLQDILKICKLKNASEMFYEANEITAIDLSELDTSEATSMYSMFRGCTELTTLNLLGLNTSKVENMEYMFLRCSKLTSLDLSSFDTSNVTDMDYMFSSCSKLVSLNVSSFETSKLTSLNSMFNQCSALTSLDVSSFNTSNVTNMRDVFARCSKLTSLDLSSFDTSNVTDMYEMFTGCSSLTSLDLSSFDTSNVTTISYMFQGCSKLTSIPELEASKVIYMTSVFNSCTNLTDLGGLKNIGKAFTEETANYKEYKYALNSSNKLTHESLMNVINNLYDLNLTYDVANGGTLYTQQLVIGSTNMAKLSADEIAIATNKGWTVS